MKTQAQVGRPASRANRPTWARPRHKASALSLPGFRWILPAVVLVVGVLYYSVGYTGYTATLDWDGISPNAKAVGADNFNALLHDEVFWSTLQHAALWLTITFVVQTVIGFTVAAILHTRVFLPTLHKVLIFIPTVLAPATMAPVFRPFYSADGFFNNFLETVGLGFLTRAWLGDYRTALFMLMVISIWQWTGLTFILYYAAMGQIDPELMEAARLDGAGNFRALWHIVWPSCRGTTIAILILSVIGTLKVFDWPWLVTNGGPGTTTEFLGTYIYRKGIKEAHIGYAAALSIALLVLAIGGALLVSRVNRKEREPRV